MDNPIWAMFFSSIVGFQYHPGVRDRLSMVECAELADMMYEQYLLRRSSWLG